jgi:hypothetical protein
MTLAVALGVSYAAAAAVYLAVVLGSYQAVSDGGAMTGWTLVAAMVSGALVLGVTVINMVYLLLQIAMAAGDCGLRLAASRVAAFLRRRLAIVALLLATLLAAVILATVASILVTAGLGFVALIPVLGLTIFWLQLAAQGLLFQFLGATALAAYGHLYLRTWRGEQVEQVEEVEK